jgi:predicted nuclease of predicted toxin-antitoxin system
MGQDHAFMRLYLDDDSASPLLLRLLRQAGHDTPIPADAGISGADDPVHLKYAVRENRALLSSNYKDFENLHDLMMQVGGHYPGTLIVRRNNDPRRDMKPPGIVRAIRNLVAAAISLADQFVILNHWR